MKVSIITVCFNGAGTIEDTIRSVLGQDHKDIEYIIIDGGSTDGTLDILAKYRGKISKFISEPDKGVYDAMNKGIALVSGDVVGFLNADDTYVDNSIIRNVAGKMRAEQADCCYGDLVYVDSRNTDRITRYWKTGEYKKGAFLHGWVLPHPVFFCKKDIFTKFGCFRDDFQIAGDFELMLRFIEKYQIKPAYIPKVLAKMRTGGKAGCLKGRIRGNWEIIQSFRMNGFRLSPWFFVYKPILKLKQLVCRRVSE